MTIGDILFFLGIVTAAFFAGRISMMNSIVKAVIDESEAENAESEELKIEKINDIYYAYVGVDFAGQAKTFDELFENMKRDQRFGTFKLTNISNLSDAEQKLLYDAIKRNYYKS